jgi:replicative DNA helicase
LKIIIAKNRSGRTGVVTLEYFKPYCRIEELVGDGKDDE